MMKISSFFERIKPLIEAVEKTEYDYIVHADSSWAYFQIEIFYLSSEDFDEKEFNQAMTAYSDREDAEGSDEEGWECL